MVQPCQVQNGNFSVHRIMYSLAFHDIARRLYEFFNNMKTVSKALGIGLGTVHRWLSGQRKTSTHRVPRYKFTDSMCDFVKFKLTQYPYLTQNVLVKELHNAYDVKVSRQCLSQVLQRLQFSRKRMKKRTNCDLKKLQMRRSSFETMWGTVPDGQLISVDEVGFGDMCLPIYGYSKKGQPAYVSRHRSRRKRLNVIMAITHDCQIHYKYVYGNVDGKLFADFITELPWSSTKHLILDNASIHRTQLVKSCCCSKSYQLLYTPPYTPEYNPIEYVFSVVKNAYRKRIVHTTLQPHELFEDVIRKLDKSIIRNCFDHVSRLVQARSIVV